MQEIMTGWYRPSRSEWLLRPRTIQLVSVAAVWWLLMVVLFLFMAIYSRANVWIIVQNSSRIETILALVCAGGAFAGTFLIVCMLWFWARLDRSRKAWRVLWFLVVSMRMGRSPHLRAPCLPQERLGLQKEPMKLRFPIISFRTYCS